jgi:hypothetical protein
MPDAQTLMDALVLFIATSLRKPGGTPLTRAQHARNCHQFALSRGWCLVLATMAPLTFSRLRRWNICVGVVQFVTGVAILALIPTNPKGKLPWYSFFISSWSRDDGLAADFYR